MVNLFKIYFTVNSLIAKENSIQSSYKFIDKKEYSIFNYILESKETIFTNIIKKYHQSSGNTIRPNQAMNVLNSLFDSLSWKQNKEKREYLNFWKKTTDQYDRFRRGSALKFMNTRNNTDKFNALKYLDPCIMQDPGFNECDQKDKKIDSFLQFYAVKLNENAKNNEGNKDKCLDENFAPFVENAPTIQNSIIDNDNLPPLVDNESLSNPKIEITEISEPKILEEEKKTEIYSGFSEKELKFFDRFYCLLDIDGKNFQILSIEKKISLLEKRYEEYVKRLSDKYSKSNPLNCLKEESELLAFLMCENYLQSEEDQYMYNELQELKFFICSLKATKLESIEKNLPKDEMLEKSVEFLKNPQFNLSSDIPLEKFISFNINQFEEKKRNTILDQSFFENKQISQENQQKPLNAFYFGDSDYYQIYDFDFYSQTLEVDDDFLLKLFQMLAYSMPNETQLAQAVNSDFYRVDIRIKSTLFLIKILCYNYRNFIRITEMLEILLQNKNYDPNSKFFKTASFENKENFKSIDHFFNFVHILLSE